MPYFILSNAIFNPSAVGGDPFGPPKKNNFIRLINGKIVRWITGIQGIYFAVKLKVKPVR
jgi:hypothetical protein